MQRVRSFPSHRRPSLGIECMWRHGVGHQRGNEWGRGSIIRRLAGQKVESTELIEDVGLSRSRADGPVSVGRLRGRRSVSGVCESVDGGACRVEGAPGAAGARVEQYSCIDSASAVVVVMDCIILSLWLFSVTSVYVWLNGSVLPEGEAVYADHRASIMLQLFPGLDTRQSESRWVRPSPNQERQRRTTRRTACLVLSGLQMRWDRRRVSHV
jgi:hypothetical protein